MNFTPSARLAGIEKSLIRQIYDRAPLDAINLGLGEPDFPTPAVIRAEAVRFINTEKIRYTPNAGLLELRRAIAGYYGDAAKYEGVCVINGSQEGLFVALMALINPGDEVLLPDPGFLAYPTLVKMAGGKPVFYKLPAKSGFAFDAEDFQRGISAKTRAVIINSPSNPTGRVLTARDFQSIAHALQHSNTLIIADEIYRELYFDERPAAIGDFYPATLVVSGLSKSHAMTGWRLGWIYGDPEIIRHVTVLHQYATTCASAVSQRAALAAFTDEGRATLARLRQDLRARRDFLVESIDMQFADLKPNRRVPDGAFYLMLEISRFGSSMHVAERMLRNKVITIPGAAFGDEAEGYLRLSFATDFDTIREGVRRMKLALTT
ncbi:MAG: pyridoxal phosphate-dependent aminotransferase [bacterium]